MPQGEAGNDWVSGTAAGEEWKVDLFISCSNHYKLLTALSSPLVKNFIRKLVMYRQILINTTLKHSYRIRPCVWYANEENSTEFMLLISLLNEIKSVFIFTADNLTVVIIYCFLPQGFSYSRYLCFEDK